MLPVLIRRDTALIRALAAAAIAITAASCAATTWRCRMVLPPRGWEKILDYPADAWHP